MRRSKNERTPAENRGIEENAARLAQAFFRKPLALVFNVGANGRIVNQGSGTLVRAASGRAVVLTAAHLLSDGMRGAVFGDTEAFDDAIADVRLMPRVDVAIAVLRDNARPLDDLAIDPNLIAEGATASVRKNDTVDVIGFPETVRVRVPDPDRGRMVWRHGDMLHRTVVAGSNRDVISIVWREGDIMEGSSAIYDSAGFKIGTRVNQKKPSGISGGAVWKQLRADDEVWTASKVFRMIAIPHEFKYGKQLAIPATRWLPWLREQLAEL